MVRIPFKTRDYLLVYARDQGLCGICGESVGLDDVSIDHIQPVALGGAHEPENWQLAHRRCNTKKGPSAAAVRVREQRPAVKVPVTWQQPPIDPLQPLYTIDEVAEMLRVHPRTIYRALVAGKLPGFKIGDSWRVTEVQLSAYMEGQSSHDHRPQGVSQHES